MSALFVDTIHKAYDAQPVLRGVSLAAEAGTTTVLLGPSGCGKTTLLRIIAGLEHADAGRVQFAGQVIDAVPAHRRGFGLMFQDYALFPHLDVAANVAYGLRVAGMGRAEVSERVAALLAQVGLSEYASRRVYELSGGERQRVALARTLAPNPRLLMFDEPLAALDRALRERLQDELRTILRRVGVTTLYVTHDQEEAFALADQVVLLNAGRVEQHDVPAQIYQCPASLWAARFLGLQNIVQGELVDLECAQTPLGVLRGIAVDAEQAQPVAVVIAADAAQANAAEAGNTVRGVLEDIQFRGRFTRVRLRHASGIALSLELPEPPGAMNAEVVLGLRPERVLFYADHRGPRTKISGQGLNSV
jgi:ABC-type Fe3+/spermidine/putrescine transport system ATPase subunit